MRLCLYCYLVVVMALGAGCAALTPPPPATLEAVSQPSPSMLPAGSPTLQVQSPASTTDVVPTPLPAVPVTCKEQSDVVQCHDDFLALDFAYPEFMGRIAGVELKPGGYSGLAYEYMMERQGGSAGGRSANFSEGRGPMWTDQSGFPDGSVQSLCTIWDADLCLEAAPGVAILGLMPDSTRVCGDGVPPIPPRVFVVVNLPEHPVIQGFGFAGALLPGEQEAALIASFRAAHTDPTACSEQGQQAFDAEMAALQQSLLHGTEDTPIQARFDAFMMLAKSIRGPYVSGGAHVAGERMYDLPVVDTVISAVTAGDATRLGERIHYSTFRCGQVAALGGPPACREGEPEGTTVAGLPLLDAEGVFARPDEQEGWLRAFLAGNPVLVGVYAQPGGLPSEADWLPATHALVFVGGDRPTIATVLSVDDEGIVSVYTDAAPAALLARITGDLVAPSFLSP
ncbi:MAG: hypothetical protein IPK16_05915 [Anaerolineales bacterium]|nr:hypothetical protein [Anaerolineales bacterium]